MLSVKSWLCLPHRRSQCCLPYALPLVSLGTDTSPAAHAHPAVGHRGRTLGLTAREPCHGDDADYSGPISLKLKKHTQLKGEEEAGRKRGHGLMGPAVTPPGRAAVPSPHREIYSDTLLFDNFAYIYRGGSNVYFTRSVGSVRVSCK